MKHKISNKPERIQKVLANVGIGSRRQIESWVRMRRITVNGTVANLGDVITNKDKVFLDQKELKFQSANQGVVTRVIAYHKPAGEICTRKDRENRNTVFANLPPLRGSRWVSIGRLDINTTGLLLFTNNGELANRLMHPSAGIDREYAVRILGAVDDKMLQRIRQGVVLEDGFSRFSDIVDSGGSGANHWYHVTLMRGRKHEVKRLWETQGVTVSRLIRVRFGPVVLPRRSRFGTFRELSATELDELYKRVDMPSEIRVAHSNRSMRRNTPSARRQGRKSTA